MCVCDTLYCPLEPDFTVARRKEYVTVSYSRLRGLGGFTILFRAALLWIWRLKSPMSSPQRTGSSWNITCWDAAGFPSVSIPFSLSFSITPHGFSFLAAKCIAWDKSSLGSPKSKQMGARCCNIHGSICYCLWRRMMDHTVGNANLWSQEEKDFVLTERIWNQ